MAALMLTPSKDARAVLEALAADGVAIPTANTGKNPAVYRQDADSRARGQYRCVPAWRIARPGQRRRAVGRVRSKAEFKELADKIDAGEFDDDIAALREMYTKVEGRPGERAGRSSQPEFSRASRNPRRCAVRVDSQRHHGNETARKHCGPFFMPARCRFRALRASGSARHQHLPLDSSPLLPLAPVLENVRLPQASPDWAPWGVAVAT